MGFCTKCGKELDAATGTCPACGAAIKKAVRGDSTTARKCLLGGAAATALLTLLALVNKDAIGVVLGAAIAGCLFFLGIKKLDEGDLKTAAMTSLIVGIAGATLGLLSLLAGAAIGVLSLAAMAPVFYAWYLLKEK